MEEKLQTSIKTEKEEPQVKEEVKAEPDVKKEIFEDKNDGDECSEEYDPEEENHQLIIFKKFMQTTKKFPDNLVGRFAELWGMMSQEIGPGGIFKKYWDDFDGNDDFKELHGEKPWEPKDNEPKDAEFKEKAMVACFNYGFQEEFWRNYHKKWSILKKNMKEITGCRGGQERSRSRSRSVSPDRSRRERRYRSTSRHRGHGH